MGTYPFATMNKKYFDDLVEMYETPLYAISDPVKIPREMAMFPESYTRKDVEIAAFIAATLAWGDRKQSTLACEHVFNDIMHRMKPTEYVMDEYWFGADTEMPIYRTFFMRDLVYICKGLKSYFALEETLETAFKYGIWDGINSIRETFKAANEWSDNKHISNPIPNRHRNGSPCKRFNLFLRWMVRRNSPVDLGLWRTIEPSQLMIPLDKTIATVCYEIGILNRKANDRIAVEIVTDRMREFDVNDPCKYVFALQGIKERLKV